MPSNLWRRSVSGLLLSGLLSLSPALIAQTSSGVVRGTVSDESGKAVVNATVTATSVNTGQKQLVNTGPAGTYQLELPTGNYRLAFEAAGFKKFEISATVGGTVPAVVDGKLERGEPGSP
jgi:Carboxypeptidase regulatory-like domain